MILTVLRWAFGISTSSALAWLWYSDADTLAGAIRAALGVLIDSVVIVGVVALIVWAGWRTLDAQTRQRRIDLELDHRDQRRARTRTVPEPDPAAVVEPVTLTKTLPAPTPETAGAEQ